CAHVPITALRTLITAVALTMGAVVVLAATWNRGRRRLRRVMYRSTAIIAVLTITLLTTGIYVNRQAGFYDSWSQLFQPASSSVGSLWTPSEYSARYGDTDRVTYVRIPGPRAG